MTAAEYWATEEIPGITWDPEPPHDGTFNVNPVINP